MEQVDKQEQVDKLKIKLLSINSLKMEKKLEFDSKFPQPYDSNINAQMKETVSTRDDKLTPFQHQSKNSKQSDPFSNIKKGVYFSHFIIITLITTYILIRYPHAREFSFTLCALVIFGYMAIWTIMVNFLFLVLIPQSKSFGKQNWAVMFDRLFIKFFMMLWPIFAIVSYIKESFLNINQVAYFSLYMCVISLILVFYELYVCTFAEHENPEFIFRKNDLTISDDLVWNQRKLYNENMIKRNNFNIDV